MKKSITDRLDRLENKIRPTHCPIVRYDSTIPGDEERVKSELRAQGVKTFGLVVAEPLTKEQWHKQYNAK